MPPEIVCNQCGSELVEDSQSVLEQHCPHAGLLVQPERCHRLSRHHSRRFPLLLP